MDSKMNVGKSIEEHVSFEVTYEQANTILKIWVLKEFNVDEILHDATKSHGFILRRFNNHDTGERVSHYVCEEQGINRWTLSIFH